MTTCWKCRSNFDPNNLMAVGVMGQCRRCFDRSRNDRAVAQRVAETPRKVYSFGSLDRIVQCNDLDSLVGTFANPAIRSPLDLIPEIPEFSLPEIDFAPITASMCNLRVMYEEFLSKINRAINEMSLPLATILPPKPEDFSISDDGAFNMYFRYQYHRPVHSIVLNIDSGTVDNDLASSYSTDNDG